MRGAFKYMLAFVAAAFLSSFAVEVSGQHYLGVRAGWGGGTGGRFFPKSAESSTLWGLYNGGVSWKYYTRQKYLGGTEVDLIFMQQGYKEYSEDYVKPSQIPGDTIGYYSQKVNSIMMPLMWQPHIYLFNRNMRVFLNAGVTFSYNVSFKEEQGSDLAGVYPDKSGKYEFMLVRDNRWGYGLVGGGGIGYSVGRIEAVAEVRYYIGYSDVRKNWNKYWEPDKEKAIHRRLRTPLDGLQASVAVFYRFGKHGILSPPSPRAAQKLMEIEQKRLRKKGLLPEEPDDGVETENREGIQITDDSEEIILPGGTEVILPETEEIPAGTDGDDSLSAFIRL